MNEINADTISKLNTKDLYFKTLIVEITHLGPKHLVYKSLIDFQNKPYNHYFEPTSKFPYQDLVVGKKYTIVSLRIGGVGGHWFYFLAFDLSNSEYFADGNLITQLKEQTGMDPLK